LRGRAEISIVHHGLRRDLSNSCQAVIQVVLVSQITAQCCGVAACQVGGSASVSLQKARVRGGQCSVEVSGQCGEVKTLHLLVVHAITRCRIIGAAIEHDLQVFHAMITGTYIPILQRDLVAITGVENQITP
jgi:hypothetical protein